MSSTLRLQREYRDLMRSPIPYILAAPLPHDILDWRYVISGPAATPYEGGCFYGRLLFPSDYPFRPPSIYMTTPNGRFKVQKRLCFSMSDYHPGEWDPAWTVSNILIGLLSFMLEDTPTYGSIDSSDSTKQHLAAESHRFNAEKTDQWFRQLFPDIWVVCREKMDREDAEAAVPHLDRGRPIKIDILDAGNELTEDVDAEDVEYPQADCCCSQADLFLVPIAIFFCLAVLVLLAIAVVLSLF